MLSASYLIQRVATTLPVLVGITARVTDTGGATAKLEAHGPVLKAGKPAAITAREGNTVQ